ncbi:MAG: hypothetical protein FRX48_05980 [Lasallia pustulata]|uniref:Uncharacterized protein n=1 Tax=Lasallia pustulata TaxID=136370 RepID=A0A5M8PNI3_9LECA|nr:MAG: hypothetical protein FRX48_05980 [Lasallia pustulata]
MGLVLHTEDAQQSQRSQGRHSSDSAPSASHKPRDSTSVQLASSLETHDQYQAFLCTQQYDTYERDEAMKWYLDKWSNDWACMNGQGERSPRGAGREGQ